MAKVMTWEEMKREYPNEWVAIINEEGETDLPYGAISGEIIAHNADETTFTAQLKQCFSSIHHVDIRYTGKLLPNNPMGPLLWQLSDTSS